MTEKFSLKWNDFQSNWNRSLSQLREDKDFADVTLITEDKVKTMTHKILLSSCSDTFKFILKECNQSNPILYLNGVNSMDLKFILDYMYYGEVNLFQEHLESFLKTAQKLEIQGLALTASEEKLYVGQDTKREEEPKNHEKDKEPVKQLEKLNKTPQYTKQRQQFKAPSNDISKVGVGSMSSEEIEAKIKELYEKVDGVWRCLACEYNEPKPNNIRRHVELHIEGLSYTCPLCNMNFRSKTILNNHKARAHKHKQYFRITPCT